MTTIYVDADACPVKEEVYRVAARYGIPVVLVANSRLRVPEGGGVRLVVVAGGQLDSADDWIAGRAGATDIVVTADVPLAARCVAAGARALDPRGRAYTEDSVGDHLATRNLMSHLREAGEITGGGPAPLAKRERSLFLQKLDELVHQVRRQ
ncbi:MAG TPA: YaiI/YqxD family protein [Candidatus Methanoperedens sp.]|nr:YaiI/YqxD family protein [Candidatus Methanoperedens sp.]